MAQSKKLVKYEGESYSLLEIPKSTSKLVILAKKRMEETINLPQLARDLLNLGMFLRLAYNGVVGYIDLQTKVRKIFYDVIGLCDETVHTIDEFRRASNTAVESLQATYAYLVEGQDNLAILNLEEIAGVADKMQVAASNLSQKFKSEAHAVEKLRGETLTAKSRVDASNKKKKRDRSEAEIEREKKEKIFQDIKKDEIQSTKEYESAVEKELQELKRQRLGFFRGFINRITEKGFGKGVYQEDLEAAKRAAEVFEKDKEKHYEEMINIREKRRKALEEMADFAGRVKLFDGDLKFESAVADSLHHAVTALQNLADVMGNAGKFWGETAGVCHELCSPKVKNMIKVYSKHERNKMWGDENFKLSAIQYYSNWIAIKEICVSYRGAVQHAQTQIHVYIRENPTQEQASITVKTLAEELGKSFMQQSEALKNNRPLAITS